MTVPSHQFTGYSTPDETEWQVMLKEAEEFDHSKNKEVEASDEYLEWFNSLPQSVRDAMNVMPRDAYYTDPETKKKVYRVYGVSEDLESGVCSYDVAQALFMRFKKCTLEATELLRIESWTKEQLIFIRCSGWCEPFICPNGWTTFASMLREEEEEGV